MHDLETIKARNAAPPEGKAMTDYMAVAIAEGFEQAEDAAQVIEAWQHLIDTGLAWKLQGSFGRQAARLIEKGLCHE